MNSPRGNRLSSANTPFFTPQQIKPPTVHLGSYPIYRERHHSAPDWQSYVNIFNAQALTPMHNVDRYRYVPQKTVISPPSRKRRGNEQVESRQKQNEPEIKRKRSITPNEEIPKTLRTDKYEKISEEILKYSSECQQTEELLQKKLRLRSTLLAIFRREFPAASLHLVGSSCNGFAANNSDADFCLMLTQMRKVDQRFEAVSILRRLQRLLRLCDYIQGLQFIRAKVPILKFSDSVSGCDCDVNVNNSIGIRNTHLLRTYSRIDSRVRPLVVTVKKWARARWINDASKGTLSSYSIVLLVLHYLQGGVKSPVVPTLQQQYPDYFKEELLLDHLPMFEPADYIPCDRSANKQSVGELLEGFFNYYANDFRWDFLAVSVRLGRATPKALKLEWREKFICIEEPFDLSNTARAVYDFNRFKLIKEEFKRAHEIFIKSPSLDTLFATPTP